MTGALPPLMYRWQHCPDCDSEQEWTSDGRRIYCNECWELLYPYYAGTGLRFRLVAREVLES